MPCLLYVYVTCRCDTLGQSLMPTPLELAGHTDSVATVDFNFDGSLVLTGGYDGLVKVSRQ